MRLVEHGPRVGPEAICTRHQEQADPARAAENGDRVLVYAERRMGKTSLAKRVLAAFGPDPFVPVYVDLWPMRTEPFVTE